MSSSHADEAKGIKEITSNFKYMGIISLITGSFAWVFTLLNSSVRISMPVSMTFLVFVPVWIMGVVFMFITLELLSLIKLAFKTIFKKHGETAFAILCLVAAIALIIYQLIII